MQPYVLLMFGCLLLIYIFYDNNFSPQLSLLLLKYIWCCSPCDLKHLNTTPISPNSLFNFLGVLRVDTPSHTNTAPVSLTLLITHRPSKSSSLYVPFPCKQPPTQNLAFLFTGMKYLFQTSVWISPHKPPSPTKLPVGSTCLSVNRRKALTPESTRGPWVG